MGAHNHFYDALYAKSERLTQIKDPGTGNTIHITFDDGVCELTIAAASETRLLDAASSLAVDATVKVVAATITNSGTCTVQGFKFASQGDWAEYRVINVNGTNTWAVVGGSSTTGQASLLFPLSMEGWHVWDAMEKNIGVTALTADDLILTTGTYGTSEPTLNTSTATALDVSQYARRQFAVPENYVAGGAITVTVKAACVTHIADTTGTLMVAAYRRAAPTVNVVSTGGADVAGTAGTTPTDFVFSFTTTNVVAGDILDIRLATTINDSTTAGTIQISEVHVAALCSR